MTEIKRRLFVDIETHGEVDLSSCGVHRYADDPSFEIMLFGYAYNGEPVNVVDLAQSESLPSQVLADLTNPNVLKIAHNANFERTCLAKWLGREMPPEQWYCTAVRAATLGLPRSLEKVGEALGLEEDERKLAIGKQLVRYFAKPCQPTKTNGGRRRNLPHHEPEKWALYKEYNRQDVVTERVIYERMEAYPPIPEKERELWALDQRMNENGVLIDTVLVNNIIAYSERYKVELEERAKQISGVDNPSSILQIKRWLHAKGLNPDTLDKDSVEKLIDELGDREPEVVAFLKIRQELGKTSTTKYDAIERAICSDKRIRGMLQFYGANRTGRWCLAEGSLVLTDQGEIPIEEVTTEMHLWDGEKWVQHDGIVFMGDKEVIEWDGVTATPEHEVFIDAETKMELREAKEKCIPIWKGCSPCMK